MTRSQRTVKNPVEVEGVGLHEGKPVRAVIRPAGPGTGVRFVRSDLPDADPVPANLAAVARADRRTLLRNGPAEVHTVEHLLAALNVLGLDNLEIEIDSQELPALDGSAAPWFEMLGKAGSVDQKTPRKTFTIERPLVVQEGGATIHAFPSEGEGLHLSYTLDYRQQGLLPQLVEVDLPGSDVAAEIAPARTFVFAAEVEALRAAGLGEGASLENTVVLNGQESPENPLRFPDEPARHKMLDLIGDLFLLEAAQGQGSRPKNPTSG